MKLKIPKVPAVSLFCIIALLFFITYPALAGQGCGTNWMGDTSSDTDFWVSKNQNQGISGPSVSGTTAAGASIKTLGAAATKTSGPSLIKSLTPDKPSPQMAGTSITWIAVSMTRTKRNYPTISCSKDLRQAANLLNRRDG